jgi:adenine specific DNA methylase Mod
MAVWSYGRRAMGWKWGRNGKGFTYGHMYIYIYMYNEAILRKQNAFKKSSSAIVLEGCYFSASF